MALVLTPELPVADWLDALDGEIGRASALFVEKPVLLDLGLIGEDADDAALATLPASLAARGIRVVAAENVADGLAPRIEALPAPLAGGRATGDVALPEPGEPIPEPPRPTGLVIDEPVRSGRQVVFAEGDVTVLGSIASGAEVMAGGSIHVYGALRGRAVAGCGGNPSARIICRKLHAELLAIDGYYLTADDMDPELLGAPAQARLDGDRIAMAPLES